MKHFLLLTLLFTICSSKLFGQLDSTISFCENGYVFKLNYRTVVNYFYSDVDSIEYHCAIGIENIINYQNLKNSSMDSLGQYVYGDSIMIRDNNFQFYDILEIMKNDITNEKVKIYSPANRLVNYKMKIKHKTEYTGSGLGGFTVRFRKIIDRKKRITIYEDHMVVGLPC
jgi:hypothetical protein